MKSSLFFVSCLAVAMAASVDTVPDIPPDTSRSTAGGLQEEPTLPSNLADIPVYKVPYAEHLLDNVKTPTDFKALPPVTFYLHGSKVSVNPWFYYSSRFKDVPAFAQYAMDEASEASSSIKSLSAGMPALMPYIPVYQVPYREELLQKVKTPKDLEALPKVTIYIHGVKAEADPWIYYSHRFKDLPAFANYHHVEKEDTASNKAPPTAETAPTFGEDGLPTNLDSIPLYKVDYPDDLVRNVKTPEDFEKLPQMVFYNNGSKIEVNPWNVYGNLFAGLPEFSDYSPMGSIQDPLPDFISQIPWYNASYPTHLIEQATTKEEILQLPDAVVYQHGVPIDIPAWKMFMLGDFDSTTTQHHTVSVKKRSSDIAVPPLSQEPSTSEQPEQPAAELPDGLEKMPFYQVPYNEKLLDSIESPEDYLNLPRVTVYVYGKMSTVPAWIYYFHRVMGLETAVHDNKEEADKDNHDMESKRAVVDGYLPVPHEEPSETINRGPDAAQVTMPPNLNELLFWWAPYPMDLLDNVRNLEDLMNLPPAVIYTYGTSTEVPAYYVFQDRFKTLTASQSSTSDNMPTMTGNGHTNEQPTATQTIDPVITSGPEFKLPDNLVKLPLSSQATADAAYSDVDLPDNLHEIPIYEVPYDLSLLDNVRTAEDLAKLPDAIVFEYGILTLVPATQRFASKLLQLVDDSTTSIDPLDIFKSGPDVATEPPQASTTFSTIIRTTLSASPKTI